MCEGNAEAATSAEVTGDAGKRKLVTLNMKDDKADSRKVVEDIPQGAEQVRVDVRYENGRLRTPELTFYW